MRTKPSTLRRPATPARPRVVNVAHRGASAYAPENTLAALRKAIARDADLVEFDIQRTKDGALVLLHDTTLARTTDVRCHFPRRGPWRVSGFTLDEIARLDAGSWKAPEYAGERIPTLSDALAVLDLSGTGALLELKMPALYPGIAGELAIELRVRGASMPQVTVQSFDLAALLDLRRLQPSLPLGVLGSPLRSELAELARWAGHVNPHHRRVDRSYVDAVHAAGMGCYLWTVNRTAAMRRALDLGADGVISNRPDVLHDLLASAAARGARQPAERRLLAHNGTSVPL